MTDDIDEIVRELRKFCDDVCGCDGVCTQRQAADALERLKGQVERLKKENLDQYRALLIRDEDVAELKDEIERLKAERDENFQEYVDTNEARIDAEARAEAAEKEVEQLQALQIEKTSDDDLGELDFQVAQEWARRGKQDDR